MQTQTFVSKRSKRLFRYDEYNSKVFSFLNRSSLHLRFLHVVKDFSFNKNVIKACLQILPQNKLRKKQKLNDFFIAEIIN